MSGQWLMALALVLVIEGILPFIAPRLWREAFRRAIAMDDGQIRFFGLSAMILGILLLFFSY